MFHFSILWKSSLKIMVVYSRLFLTKNSWKQRFYSIQEVTKWSISRNIFLVRENLCFSNWTEIYFHTFSRNFREIDVFTKEFELLNGWFDEIMRKTSKFFWFYFRFHEKFRQTETLFVLLRIGWKLKFILQQRSWYWNCLLIIKHSVWRNYFKNTFCNLKWLLKIRTRYFK